MFIIIIIVSMCQGGIVAMWYCGNVAMWQSMGNVAMWQYVRRFIRKGPPSEG
jgi:hypothetical protein